MATCINSSQSCLPPFYTIPTFPLLNRKIFHMSSHWQFSIARNWVMLFKMKVKRESKGTVGRRNALGWTIGSILKQVWYGSEECSI